MSRVVVLALALVMTASVGARADDDDRDPWRFTAWAEAAVVLGIPTVYYWQTQEDQEVDWTRDWGWASWKAKLVTFDADKFDTNPFHVNAVRHPLTGVIDYHVARTNGFGALASTIFAYATGIVWEMVIEYREDPSINDMIMNGAGGLAIGEPLWQFGQLWRSSDPTPLDRVRTAVFSPLDVWHDLVRGSPRTGRSAAFRSIELAAGLLAHGGDTRASREATVRADLELVGDATAVGGRSRLAFAWRAGALGGGELTTGTWAHARTSLAGDVVRDGDRARYVGLGTAFTYRRDRLGSVTDHAAFAHLVGPQLAFVHGNWLRFDAAAYGDFAMIDAHAIAGRNPFPSAPPYTSTLQARGYYDGFGVSLLARVRAERGSWFATMELAGHRVRQIDAADRGGSVESRTLASEQIDTPHGASDRRFYMHAELGRRPFALALDASSRRGTWSTLEQTDRDLAIGALATFAL